MINIYLNFTNDPFKPHRGTILLTAQRRHFANRVAVIVW